MKRQTSMILGALALFIVSITFFIYGLFLTKKPLTNISKPIIHNEKMPDKQVILLLVDALREDFVEMDSSKTPFYLDRTKSIYKGKKLKLFNDLLIAEPQNTILLPLASEMPTVTSVRVKGVLTGALNTFFEISENFGSNTNLTDDNLLLQLKLSYQNASIVFSGDYIWMDMFGKYFDRTYPYPSFNVRDLDTLDNQVEKDILKEIEANNFTLLIGHIIGIDHAGHTYSANHHEIERKIKDTQRFIKAIIENMNEDTVLIVFGDHGMTDDGNHGGGSLNELKSVIFSYTKKGFLRKDLFGDKSLNSRVKQLDISAIVSGIFNISIPFQNLGSFMPMFSIDGDITHVYQRQILNLHQLQEYIISYCNVSYALWCDSQITDINDMVDKYSAKDIQQDQMIKNTMDILSYFDQKYKKFQDLWISYNEISIFIGVAFAVVILIFIILAVIIFPNAIFESPILELFQPIAIIALVPAIIIIAFYFVAFVYSIRAIQMFKRLLEGAGTCRFSLSKDIIIQNLLSILIFAFYFDCAFADSFTTEADYLVDIFILLLIFQIFIQQKNKLKRPILFPILMIIGCMKLAYFYDREKSMNFQIDPVLLDVKQTIQEIQIISTYLPWLGYIIVEFIYFTDSSLLNFIERVISVGQMVSISIIWSLEPTNNFRNDFAKLNLVVAFIMIIIVILRKRNYDDPSILTTKLLVILIKPIFILTGSQFQLVILLCIVQHIQFGKLISNSKITPNYITIGMIQYFTMIQYFYRTSHRERFSSIQFGKAYLGFTEYNFYLHGFLVFLITYSSHFIGILITPYVVRKGIRDNQLKKKNEDRSDKRDIADDQEIVDKGTILREKVNQVFSIMILMTTVLFACSSIMAAVTKRELMFPQRTAPKYIFDLIQTGLIYISGILISLIF